MLLIIMLMLLAAAAFWVAVLAMIAWVVQFAILNATARGPRFPRWLALAVPALLLGLLAPRHPFIGSVAAGAVLLGWALAWLVYKAVCGGDGEDPAEPGL